MPREALIKSCLPPLSAAPAHRHCTDILAFGRPGMCRRPGEISPSAPSQALRLTLPFSTDGTVGVRGGNKILRLRERSQHLPNQPWAKFQDLLGNREIPTMPSKFLKCVAQLCFVPTFPIRDIQVEVVITARILEQTSLDATDRNNLNAVGTRTVVRDTSPCSILCRAFPPCDRYHHELQHTMMVSTHCLEPKSGPYWNGWISARRVTFSICNATDRQTRQPTVARPHYIVVAVRRGRWPGCMRARSDVGEIPDVSPRHPRPKLPGTQVAHTCC